VVSGDQQQSSEGTGDQSGLPPTENAIPAAHHSDSDEAENKVGAKYLEGGLSHQHQRPYGNCLGNPTKTHHNHGDGREVDKVN
jgi:hypothetical protein